MADIEQAGAAGDANDKDDVSDRSSTVPKALRRGISRGVSRVSARLLRALGVSLSSMPPPPPLPPDADYSDEDDDEEDDGGDAKPHRVRRDPELGDPLLARLEQHLQLRAHKQALVWLDTSGEAVETLTFQELLFRADAARLMMRAQWDVMRGGKVLLVFQPGLEFVCALVGCLLGGFVAIPVVPPETTNPGPELAALRHAVRSTGVMYALTHDTFQRTRGFIGNGKFPEGLQWESVSQALRIISHVNVTEAVAQRLCLELKRGFEDSELALVQLSSGAGGAQKPVMLSHGNLGAALWTTQRALRASADDVGVFWAAPYQGMGLVGTLLHGLYSGSQTVLLAPSSFARNPLLWLRAVHEYGAQMTWAPNYAYETCARVAGDEDKARLDISSCRRWGVGMELVAPETLSAFSKAFAPCGFDVSAWDVQYSCAEFGALVTAHVSPRMPLTVRLSPTMSQEVGALAEEVPDSRAHAWTLVGAGEAVPGARVAIVHPGTRQRLWRRGTLGEIWCAGPSKGVGYFGKRKETMDVFRARVEAPAVEDETAEHVLPDDGTWLRTGDLGFMLHGELFVCGRMSEVMVVDGRHVFPDDMERSAQAASALIGPGAVTVFSVSQLQAPTSRGTRRPGGGGGGSSNGGGGRSTNADDEAVVIVVEVEHRRASVSKRIFRAATSTATGVRSWFGTMVGSDADRHVQGPYPVIEGRFTPAALIMESKTTPEEDLRRVAQRVRHAVQSEHRLRVLDVTLVPRNALTKTSTGKVKRQETRKRYLSNALGAVFSSRRDPVMQTLVDESGFGDSAASDSLETPENGDPGPEQDDPGQGEGAPEDSSREERMLLRRVHAITGDRDLEVTDDLFEAGVGAVQMQQLTAEVRALAKRELPADFMLRHRSVRQAVSGAQSLDKDPMAPQQRTFNIPERGSDGALPRLLLWTGQLLGVAALLLLLAAPIIPAYRFARGVQYEWGLGAPWAFVELPDGVAVFGLLLPLVIPIYMTTLTLLVVAAKWAVAWRWREGSVRMGSFMFLRWWFVDRLLCIWELLVGKFLVRTQLLTLVYRLLGARLASDCRLRTFLREPDLVTVGPRSHVDAQLVTRLFDPLERSVNFRPVRVGADARLRETAVVLPGAAVQDGVVLEQLSVMSQGLVTEPGCVYAGAPCFVVAPPGHFSGAAEHARDLDTGGSKLAKPKKQKKKERKGAGQLPHSSSFVGGRFENGTYGARGEGSFRSTFEAGPDGWVARGAAFAAGLALHGAGLLLLLYTVALCAVPALWAWGGLRAPYATDQLGRYAPLALWATVVVSAFFCAAVASVPAKWLLLGRRQPGDVGSLDCSGAGLARGGREWFVDNLFRVAADGPLKLFERTQSLLVLPRLLGAGIGLGTFMAAPLSSVPPSRADMLRVGRNCELDDFTLVAEQGGQRARLHIARDCEVGLLAAIGGQSVVPRARGEDVGSAGGSGGGATRMEQRSALGAASRLSGETLSAGKLKVGEAVFPRDGEVQRENAAGGVRVRWSALEEVWVMACRVLLLALLVVCLIPSYEVALLVLYDGDADFHAAPPPADGRALDRHLAVLLLGGSIGIALPSFALLQRATTLLALGLSRHLLAPPCRSSTLATATALTSFLEGLLVPLIHGTALFTLYCRFMGAHCGTDVFLYSRHVTEHQLHRFNDGCVVDEHARVSGQQMVDGSLRVGPSTVGAFAYVAPFALVLQSSTVDHESVLPPYGVATPARLIARERVSTAYTTQRYLPRGRSARMSNRLAPALPDATARGRRGSSII